MNYKKITSAQAQVLALVVFGMSNKEIAKEMFVTELSIKQHLNRAAEKLGYKGMHRWRTKFVSDFFLGKLCDDQCAGIIKNFQKRLHKIEGVAEAAQPLTIGFELPRGIN